MTTTPEQSTSEQQPAEPTDRLIVLDGRDALAYVVIRPADEDPERIAVEASARGMSKAVAAYALRQTAEEFDRAALAEGDTPITAEEAAAEQQQRAAVPDRPALALLTEIYEELGHDRRSMPLAAALLDQYARELADRITALGKARGWSTWAADYIHPDREFVDTGEDDDATLTPYHGEHGYPEGEEPEQPPVPRVLTDAEEARAYLAARDALTASGAQAGSVATEIIITAALATIGVLTAPPEPEPDACPAMFADREGQWRQCAEDPDHNSADGHDDGEWSWPDGRTYATPDEDDAEAQR